MRVRARPAMPRSMRSPLVGSGTGDEDTVDQVDVEPVYRSSPVPNFAPPATTASVTSTSANVEIVNAEPSVAAESTITSNAFA